MARRSKSLRQQKGVYARSQTVLHSTVDFQPQELSLPLMLPPSAPPSSCDAAAVEPQAGSHVIIIDLA